MASLVVENENQEQDEEDNNKNVLDLSLSLQNNLVLNANRAIDDEEYAEYDYDPFIAPVEYEDDPNQQIVDYQRERGISIDSESSTETIVGKGGCKTTKNQARFSFDTKQVTPGNRGPTNSGLQGEHTVAYIVYESICQRAIAGKRISEAAALLEEKFSSFLLPENSMLKMQEEMKTLSNEAMTFRLAKRSLKTLKSLGCQPFLSEDDYSATLQALIIAARLKYATMIETGVDIFLLGVNKTPNVSYPTEGVPENPNSGKEKSAKNNLLLLENFLERTKKGCTSDIERENLLADFTLLKNLKAKWGINTDYLDELFLDGDVEVSYLQEKLVNKILQTVRSQLIRHMTELYYYPCLKDTHRYSIGDVVGDWAATQQEWFEAMKLDLETGKRLIGKPQKYSKGTLPRSNDVHEMAKTVGKAQVAFAHMLPALAMFGETEYEKIMRSFLEESTIKKGWAGWIICESQVFTDDILGSLVFIVEEYHKMNYKEPLRSCLLRFEK